MSIYQFKGIHILAEFYGVASEDLQKKSIVEIIDYACIKANITCVKTNIHYFENGGYTLCSLLAESHISIHTYLEHGSVFLDIFTCGNCDPLIILNELEGFYCPTEKKMEIIKRGNDNLGKGVN